MPLLQEKKSSFLGIALGYGSPPASRSGSDAEVMSQMRHEG